METKRKCRIACFVIGTLLATQVGFTSIPDTLDDKSTQPVIADTMETPIAVLTEEKTDTQSSKGVSNTLEDQNEFTVYQGGSPVAGISTTLDTSTTEEISAAVAAQAKSDVSEEFVNVAIANVEAYLNVRQEPTTESAVIGILPKGGAGQILETTQGWTKISSGSVEGWVSNDYIITGAEAEAMAVSLINVKITSAVNGLRVRTEPSIGSQTVVTLTQDQQCQVLELSDASKEQAAATTEEIKAESSEAETESAEEVITEDTSQAATAEETAEDTAGETAKDISEDSKEQGDAESADEAGTQTQTEAGEQTDDSAADVSADESASEENISSEENGGQPESSAETEEATISEEMLNNPENWIKIQYGSGEGYVYSEFVTVSYEMGTAMTIDEYNAMKAQEEAERLAKEEAERAAAAAAAAAQQQASANTSSGSTVTSGTATSASYDETYLLAAMCQVEAGGSYEGMLAVANVILNRTRSGSFPGSISGVIYQQNQFATGSRFQSILASGPSSSAMSAASAALAGQNNVGGYLYFRAASSADTSSYSSYVMIGGNCFYSR